LGELTEGGDKELISMSFWIGLVSERFMLMGCDLGTLLLTTVCQKKTFREHFFRPTNATVGSVTSREFLTLLGVCGSSFLSV
jgi:hypothetical protein